MNTLKHPIKTLLLALTVCPLLISGATWAESESESQARETTKKCLPLRSISRVEVVDNQHLIFHLNNRERYLNTLPNKCPGLSKHDPIMYKTSLSSLCDLDTITVLHNFGGGLQPGATCGLGKFELQPELE